MQIKTLNKIDFGDLVACFNEAFAEYFVKMPTSIDYWEKRWKAARVDYSLSFGMFDDGKLVGFIVNGIDYKNELLTAFNTGTGVLPAYRGKKIVKQLYDFSIPVLVGRGIQNCALEVITKNTQAVKAYESAGFEITKTLICYSGELRDFQLSGITTKPVPFEKIPWEKLINQQFYSWDNLKKAIEILKDEFRFFYVFEKDKEVGYFILNPNNGYLAQFEWLKNNDNHSPQKLFEGIRQINAKIRINNIDARLEAKIEAVETAGLKNTIDQYEMELLI